MVCCRASSPTATFLSSWTEASNCLRRAANCSSPISPTCSKRKRFFASDAGIRFHQEFMGTSARPDVSFNVLEPGALDDAIVLAIVARCRAAGFDAYIVPQRDGLPCRTGGRTSS